MTRGKASRPPPLRHTHTSIDTHKDGHTPLGQDGGVSWRKECGQTGRVGGAAKQSTREKEEGRGEAGSSDLIGFGAPPLRPGVSQLC